MPKDPKPRPGPIDWRRSSECPLTVLYRIRTDIVERKKLEEEREEREEDDRRNREKEKLFNRNLFIIGVSIAGLMIHVARWT